jgi:CHAT domain-containing protein
VVVGDPTGDLEHAEDEAEEIGETLGVEPILGAAATKEAVMAGLRSASMVHIAGHARFNVGAPLDSGIAVADGVITAREVLSERIHLDLLVLSACETGTAESLGGYEYAGLTQAFQVAGARCVVASLWKVDDPVTAVLMDRFYESWRAGADLARALSDAMDASATDTASPAAATRGQRELVDSGPSAGTRPPTYYWDSFVISGDWTTAPPFS